MVSRRTFLDKLGTAALVAAVLPAVQALPSAAAPASPPAPPLIEQEPWDFLALLEDPEIADTVRFTIAVAEYQMSDEDVEVGVGKLRAWGHPMPANMTDRQLAAAGAVVLWFSRMTLAEFHAHHAATYERWARPYWELVAIRDAQRGQTA